MTYRAAYAALAGLVPADVSWCLEVVTWHHAHHAEESAPVWTVALLPAPDGSTCLRVERPTAEELIAAVSSLYLAPMLDAVGAP